MRCEHHCNALSQDPGSKKSPAPLDSLTKEELVTRCKSLLQLAQKAKVAKDGEQRRGFSRYVVMDF